MEINGWEHEKYIIKIQQVKDIQKQDVWIY